MKWKSDGLALLYHMAGVIAMELFDFTHGIILPALDIMRKSEYNESTETWRI